MSFSRDVKDEICKNLPSDDCCVRAMLYGLLLCSHSFGEEGIALTTDNEAVVWRRLLCICYRAEQQ